MNTPTRLATLLALAALALPASGKTYYVDASNGSDANNGLKATTAFATIQKAIKNAAAGSTILVYPGTYNVGDPKGKKVTIKSVDGTEETFIEPSYVPTDWSKYGGDIYSDVIELGKWGTQRYYASGHWKTKSKKRTGTSTKLEGFTLTGPIQCGTISHCTISGADQGVGTGNKEYSYSVLVQNANVLDSLIEGNDVPTLVYHSTLTRCTISGNKFSQAIADLATLCNCLVEGNQTKGTMSNYAIGTKTGYITKLFNTTIANNTIGWGWSSTAAVAPNCDVFNCIIWGNRTPGGTPANILFSEDDKTGATVAFGFMNYYAWSNSKYQLRKASRTMRNTLVEDFAVVQKGNKKAAGNIMGDPCFVDSDHGDFHLSPWSPCANTGADYTKKTGKYDLDSAARKVGKKVDMGAYEVPAQVAVPADYDGDGITDAAFYFAASGQWWIFQSRDGLRTISLPDRNGVPCPADYDGDVDSKAEPAYFTASAKMPEFVRISLDGDELERTAFGAKGATPVAAKLDGAKATFGVYTANAKKPQFAFQNGRTIVYGAKASRPVAADFDADGKDDHGVYTATASKPAFSILQSSKGYATANPFQGGPVALGAKGAIPCCADFDGDGGADFGIYRSNTKAPYFQRLFSSSQFRETRTLPMGSKGDVPVVGVYETGEAPTPAVWTGTKWTYVDSSYTDVDLLGD